MNRYYGKYRGKVAGNTDIDRMGKLLVTCPRVLGTGVVPAMPCVPFAGRGEGFYMLPGIGSNVWVEFEAGDPSRPIWSGCFWDEQSIPTAALLPSVRTITTAASEVTLDDAPGGGLRLRVGPPVVQTPCTISCSTQGITISFGSSVISLDVKQVDVNNGALQVV
ncbi:phage baseplate assembly protein V [Geodermatophilus sp. SYSU D00710]